MGTILVSRFHDPSKWQSPSFRKLKPAEKLLIFYINDVCNNAGFLEFDPEDCVFRTKMNEAQVNQAYNGIKHLIDENKGWIYIKGFLKEQRNLPLKSNNNSHLQIIRLIVDMKDMFPHVYQELVQKPGIEKDIKTKTPPRRNYKDREEKNKGMMI